MPAWGKKGGGKGAQFVYLWPNGFQNRNGHIVRDKIHFVAQIHNVHHVEYLDHLDRFL